MKHKYLQIEKARLRNQAGFVVADVRLINAVKSAWRNQGTSEVEMICFEVWVNGEKICLAGVGDGVLTCILDGGRRGLKSNLHVGGLINDEHVRWTRKSHALEVGDEVTIKIVEADAADEPVLKYPRKKQEQE